MLRLEEINHFAKEWIQERMDVNLIKLENILQTEGKSIQQEFLNVFDRLFQACILEQKAGRKQEIKYIHMCYLKSAMLTQKLEFQMNVYTKMSYLDEVECMELWQPHFLMDFYRKDMEDLDKEARKKVIHYGYPQFRELQERCFSIYIGLMYQYVMQVSREVIQLDAYKRLAKEEEVQMIYGGYMDKGILLWSSLQEEKA